jgi:hypothetical protein
MLEVMEKPEGRSWHFYGTVERGARRPVFSTRGPAFTIGRLRGMMALHTGDILGEGASTNVGQGARPPI